jgi:putative phage-type endonuclease
MKIVQLQQGSPEWHAHRARYFNASDAPAMMGCSPYKTRAELLREVSTGVAADVDAGTQRIFNAGHRFEALARPLGEEIVGDDLYPCVGVEGKYSASFDGLTLGGETAFEHKTLSAGLAEAMRDGMSGDDLPLHYKVQMEHQCMVSGAERVLFMASKWHADDTLIDSRHCWYEADPELRADVIAGWQQFAADLAAYVPPAIPEPARAEPMESLPAVAVRLDGALTVAGNLPTFAQALRAFIDKMPTKPATDNEFATVDAACKALKKAEEALDQAEAGALASITDVEAMRRAVADCRKLARDTRLAAEKLVERRKLEMKEQAVAAARAALDKHVAALNAELAPMRLLAVAADFPGAIKGLRSISSMQDALDTALANGKILADAQARLVRGNLEVFKRRAAGLEFLFSDLGAIVHKPRDDFDTLVDARVDKHKADEARLEQERQAAEAARIAAAEQRAREQAQREAAAALAAAASPPPAPVYVEPAVDRVAREQMTASAAAHAAQVAQQPANQSTAEPATINMGALSDMLGFQLRTDFIASVLNIQPAGRAGAAVLYRQSQVPLIVAALQRHLARVLAGLSVAA